MENYRENTNLPSGAPPRRLLGQVLVDGEFISHYDLDRAQERQKRTNEMLGEVLVGMGVLDPAALVAALSMANVAGAQAASPAESGMRSGSAQIQVSARVAPTTSLKVLRTSR